ncbi:hypothetical protein [Galbibacter sp.]|uniref:hypothetical protein n=1 Tax=Galbibacter sp. TaxID=2918471 RepID=UPI003A8D5E14
MSILKQIEKDSGILNLKYKGESIWPVLRLKSYYKYEAKQKGTVNRTRELNFNAVWVIFKSFFYGTHEFFNLSQFDYLVFSGSERRKRYNDLYHERVVEGFLASTKSLLIENPFPLGKHYKKDEIPTKHIMSESILYLGVFVLGFLGFKMSKLENEHIIKDIQQEYGYEINYNRFLLIYEGQYRLFKLILKYFKKPKAVFFVYSASSMGYIKALKEFNIPVVEIQHGVVNKEHNAYNVYGDFGRKFFPDYFLTYGNREMEVFQNPENYFIDPKNVMPVGYYLLDQYLNNQTGNHEDYITSLRKNYKKIVVYTHQEVYENEILDFLIESAKLSNDIVYLLIPRNDLKVQPEGMPDNLIVETKLNIYDCLRFSDIHSTIFSTCAIEALSYGVPNVMYNYQNWSKSYYEEIFNDKRHTVFIESPYEFVDVILSHHFESKAYIEAASDQFFKRNFLQNMESFMESEIKA